MTNPEDSLPQFTETPSPIDGNNLRGADERYAAYPALQPEALPQSGTALVAEHLAVAAEGGAEGIRAYLSDVLADTSEQIPRTERAAVFSLLAERQKRELRRDTIEAGRTMASSMHNNDSQLLAPVEVAGAEFQAKTATLQEAHKRGVGRAVTGGVNSRIAISAHEEASNTAVKIIGRLETLPQSSRKWNTAQTKELHIVRTQIESGARHERVLHEAGQTLNPDYRGEQKDLSVAITDSVKSEMAAELFKAVQESQNGGVDIVTDVNRLLEEKQSDLSANAVSALRSFVTEYDRLLTGSTGRVSSSVSENAAQLRRFVSHGRTTYPYVRRAEELAEAYRLQNRRLDEVSRAAQSLQVLVKATRTSSGQSLQKLQHILSAQ